VEGDEYGIVPALPTLALAYSRVRKTLNNHTQRRSIDEIIELAFSVGLSDRHCDFRYVFSPRAFAYISYNLAIRTEESYRLVALAGNPDAQSDVLVRIPSATIADKYEWIGFPFEATERFCNTCIGPLVGRQTVSQSSGSLENSRRMIMTAIKTS